MQGRTWNSTPELFIRPNMDGRPALSVQTSSPRQLGASGALSSSLPVLPCTLEEKYPKFPNSQQVSLERDLVTDPLVFHPNPLPSSVKIVGHMFSSSSGYASNEQFSSSSHETHSSNYPYISPSASNGSSLALGPSNHADLIHSSASNTRGNNISWCSDSGPGFPDFTSHTSLQNGHIQGNADGGSNLITHEELLKRNDWQEWADQLITDDESLSSNWGDLLIDTSTPNHETKVGLLHTWTFFFPFAYGSFHNRTAASFSVHHCSSLCFFRCRTNWLIQPQICRCTLCKVNSSFLYHQQKSQQLALLLLLEPHQSHACAGHQNFMKPLSRQSINLVAAKVSCIYIKFDLFCMMDAASNLTWASWSAGATPKGVLKLMKVEGLTIYHVKSHLQACRTLSFYLEMRSFTLCFFYYMLPPFQNSCSICFFTFAEILFWRLISLVAYK